MKLLPLVFTADVLTLTPLSAQMLPQVSPKDVGLGQERLDRIRPVMDSCRYQCISVRNGEDEIRNTSVRKLA